MNLVIAIMYSVNSSIKVKEPYRPIVRHLGRANNAANMNSRPGISHIIIFAYGLKIDDLLICILNLPKSNNLDAAA